MKPTAEAYTVALPWYEEQDFATLRDLAQDREEMPPLYADWHRDASRLVGQMLATGRAIEVVTVRPEPLIAWLAGAPCTAETRRRYVEEVAASGPAGERRAPDASAERDSQAA